MDIYVTDKTATAATAADMISIDLSSTELDGESLISCIYIVTSNFDSL